MSEPGVPCWFMRPETLGFTRNGSPMSGGASVGDMSGDTYLAAIGAALILPAIGATMGYFLGKPSGHGILGAVGGALAIEAVNVVWLANTNHI